MCVCVCKYTYVAARAPPCECHVLVQHIRFDRQFELQAYFFGNHKFLTPKRMLECGDERGLKDASFIPGEGVRDHVHVQR